MSVFTETLRNFYRIFMTACDAPAILLRWGIGPDRPLLLLVETVLSRLTVVSHCKQGMHRVWVYFQTCLAFTMAAFDVLVQWQGFVPLLVAEFNLYGSNA